MQHVEEHNDSHDTLQKSIIAGLREFYLSEILCDATIETAGKRFLCHRVVLSSLSPYFQVLFTCPMKESMSGEVSLLDIPASVMEIVLRFIYTGEADISMDNVEELFTVSSRLQIGLLQEFCTRFFKKYIDGENCLWIYRLAHSHNDQSLLDVAMQYISLHLTGLAEKEDFFYLELSELTRILSSDQLLVSSELTIYNVACRWWELHSDEDSPLPEELVKVVRFPLMDPCELTEVKIDIPTSDPAQNSTEFYLRLGMFEDRILGMDMSERDEPFSEQEDYHINAYDPITDSWEKLPFISPLYQPGLLAMGNILYVAGGQDEDRSVSNLLHMYDSVKNEWKDFPPMAKPRYGHGFLHYRDALYAVGGCDGEEAVSSAECFSLVEKCWTEVSSMPSGLRSFTSAQLKGRLILIGGLTGSVKKSSSHQGFLIYDISSDTWSKFPLPVTFSDARAVVFNEKLYVIASYNSRHGNYDPYPPYDEYQAFLLYYEQSNTIPRSFCMDYLGRICYCKIPPILESVAEAAVVVWRHRIYIVGGSGSDGFSHQKIYYWTPGDPKWTRSSKDIPFLFDGYLGGVTMQVPMKRFHDLIPGRKSSYNFRIGEHYEEQEELWWQPNHSI
ncbi:kelch repeat and BTB domain-containing protein 8-like [Ranitomeya variabilis]|uniref:kelch repeat and BTB domain-containing protein 8-like n=1 Tax=Ranitomeya variabilis TaxID=490064 RepID=UPI004057B1D5